MTAPPDFRYWYRVKCLCVVEADTIDVLTDPRFRVGPEQRVRLYGIKGYEPNDRDPAKRVSAAKGKAYVAARVEGKEVVLNTVNDCTRKYGRWLAVVHYLADDGTWHDLNEELLAQGLAVPMKG